MTTSAELLACTKAPIRVRVTHLGSTDGWHVGKEHLFIREAGMTGEATYDIPDHDEQVWWVQHDTYGPVRIEGCYLKDDIYDGGTAAYHVSELEIINQ